ncbi:major facilitator superfamily transporter [Colletotrichum truncatum]|uniref:Major facilitator superfamily transporter n=1 Tax=Colletotrichum truncatum TaxID=5467 RepID=A0ACC3YPD2_COLTU|nr:major facilitator superfamily transporter [Colletotrichum truncatum]KAF6784222.1 major facilitator superfamily transporter [Colletotrichum truncatum]
MDNKCYQAYPRNAISLESLHPIELSSDFDSKKDEPINFSASAPPTILEVPLNETDTQIEPGPVHVEDAKLKSWARWALFIMAFFMGDVQDGLGPFLGVYLQQRGWAPGLRGSVNTVSGVATIIATGPIGALIDATNHKRLLVATCALLVGVSQGLNLLSTHPALVFSTQIVSAVAGTSMMPLLVALTLGICSHDRDEDDASKSKHSFRSLNGRNQAANHAGNMVSAGLAGLLGSRFGLTAVFWLVIAFCVATMVSVFLLPERAIDHKAARGGPPAGDGNGTDDTRQIRERRSSEAADDEESGESSLHESPNTSPKAKVNTYLNTAFRLFVNNRPLGVVAVTIFLFHLGNAAILFLYGQALVAAGEGDPAGTTGLTVIIAQGTMVIMSILTSWFAGRQGYWFTVLISYAVLPIRAAIAGRFIKSWGVWPVQILDGIGAGIQSVAIPGLLAVMMAGSGRVNVTFGIVGGVTRQTGAAISHSLGGWMAQVKGYSFALYLSGVFPLVSLAMWAGCYKMLRPVMDRKAKGIVV